MFLCGTGMSIQRDVYSHVVATFDGADSRGLRQRIRRDESLSRRAPRDNGSR